MRSAAGLLPKRPRILTPRVADKKRYKRHVAFATLRRNGRPRPQTPFFTLVLSTFLLHLPPMVARGRPWSPMPPQMPPDASQMPPDASQMPPDASRCLPRCQMPPDARCQMPPQIPDASRCQMPDASPDARCLPDASRCLPGASQMPPDVQDTVWVRSLGSFYVPMRSAAGVLPAYDRAF